MSGSIKVSSASRRLGRFRPRGGQAPARGGAGARSRCALRGHSPTARSRPARRPLAPSSRAHQTGRRGTACAPEARAACQPAALAAGAPCRGEREPGFHRRRSPCERRLPPWRRWREPSWLVGSRPWCQWSWLVGLRAWCQRSWLVGSRHSSGRRGPPSSVRCSPFRGLDASSCVCRFADVAACAAASRGCPRSARRASPDK